jgi:hypothetical protein
MANEREASFRMPQGDTKKGQMMLIYLPEGSVIVDRNNVDMNDTMNVAYGQSAAGQTHAGNSSMGSSDINSDQFPRPEFVRVDPQFTRRNSRRGEQLFLRRRHRVEWLHAMNVTFASYVALVSIAPLLLSALFGVSVFTSKSNTIGDTVQPGQLLIAHSTPVALISTGDLVLFRSPTSWKLLVRQVTDKTTTGTSTTLSTNSGANTSLTEVFSLDNYSKVRYVSSYIPFLGYVTMFFSLMLVKVLVVLGVLIANVVAFYHRRRRRPLDEKLVYVAR